MKKTKLQLNQPHLALRRGGLTVAAVALAGSITVIAAPSPASAQDFTLQLEPAVAFWVDTPQSDRFTPGLYAAVRPAVTLGPVMSLQASYALLYTPAADGFTEDGSAHLITAGIRLRPFGYLQAPSDQLAGLFVDFNLGYVRTGDLDRVGFDAGLGYGFQLSPQVSLGPVVRYGQIVQADDTVNFDSNDGQYVTLGLSLAFGAAHEEEVVEPVAEVVPTPEPVEELVCPPVIECIQETPVALPCTCADADGDGVCDVDDRCPANAGPAETAGCPVDPCTGKPLLMLVQFNRDSATLPAPRKGDVQTMDPVLDAVAKAISLDPTCRVCIIGYASEEGSDAYNQKLSAKRAKAVQGYMSASGLPKSRIPTTGMGERCQLKPPTTLLLNRRVEFRRLEQDETCPSECSEQ